MNFSKLKNGLKAALINSGYSRTARELNRLSNSQLKDIGISRALLKKGASAFPWREETISQIVPNNVTNLNTLRNVADVEAMPEMPKTPKAA